MADIQVTECTMARVKPNYAASAPGLLEACMAFWADPEREVEYEAWEREESEKWKSTAH